MIIICLYHVSFKDIKDIISRLDFSLISRGKVEYQSAVT